MIWKEIMPNSLVTMFIIFSSRKYDLFCDWELIKQMSVKVVYHTHNLEQQLRGKMS